MKYNCNKVDSIIAIHLPKIIPLPGGGILYNVCPLFKTTDIGSETLALKCNKNNSHSTKIFFNNYFCKK